VIDADDVTIANNSFRDITGDPGSPVDVEPDYPEQHGNRITIRDNFAFRCYRGFMVTLQNGGPTAENFREETITGNKVVGTLYGYGIYVALQHRGATVSGNTIEGPAGEGIYLLGSSHVQVTNNVITDPGRCHTVGNCRREATGTGIRVEGPSYVTGNVITGNTIKDTQNPPTLLYGVEFSSTGKGNTIRGNVASRFDPVRGEVVHVSGKADFNTISENKKQ
jgi:parallel beta-helix repeat protein